MWPESLAGVIASSVIHPRATAPRISQAKIGPWTLRSPAKLWVHIEHSRSAGRDLRGAVVWCLFEMSGRGGDQFAGLNFLRALAAADLGGVQVALRSMPMLCSTGTGRRSGRAAEMN